MSDKSKREVIESILKKHKGAGNAADILTEANAAGIETTVGYVRLVRYQMQKDGVIPQMRPRKAENKARRKHGQPNAAPVVNGFSTADLLAVKALSQRFGVGLDALPGKVGEAVATLKELAS